MISIFFLSCKNIDLSAKEANTVIIDHFKNENWYDNIKDYKMESWKTFNDDLLTIRNLEQSGRVTNKEDFFMISI